MGKIFDAMVSFFDEDDWKYSVVEEDTILRLGFSGKNGNWQCYAQAKEEAEQCTFYSICPVKTPEGKRLEMAEFITRANYGLILGNFELDFDDGEIRYKTSIDVEDDRLSSALMKHLVYANILTMDQYMPGIMAVLYAGTEPARAVAEIEGGDAEGRNNED